jgi:hypothetical protein
MPPSTTSGASQTLLEWRQRVARLFQRWLYEHCTKLKFVRKQLIINEIVVEAAGVELISVLTTRKLLILGTARTAKKAPLPNPLYVYCTKMLSALSVQQKRHGGTVLHRFSEMDRKSTSAIVRWSRSGVPGHLERSDDAPYFDPAEKG